MRPDVRARFVPFTAGFEGTVPFMYLDVKNLVTCAIGNLIDSVAEAQACPWVHIGSVVAAQYGAGGPLPATPAEVAAEWHYVKSRTDLSQRGGGAYGAITHLRLTDDGVAQVVGKRIGQMDATLAQRYAFWEALPADAQLAVLSMAWAAGPAFKAPKFDAALQAGDWATFEDDANGVPVLVGGCAKECHLDDRANPGLKPRNRANSALFMALNQQTPAASYGELGGIPANESELSDIFRGACVR